MYTHICIELYKYAYICVHVCIHINRETNTNNKSKTHLNITKCSLVKIIHIWLLIVWQISFKHTYTHEHTHTKQELCDTEELKIMNLKHNFSAGLSW